MGASLVKKLLCRKDYVEIIPVTSPEKNNKEINSFLEKVRNERGKIIRIEGMESVSSHYADGEFGIEGTFTNTDNSYLVHYRCYKQIILNH